MPAKKAPVKKVSPKAASKVAKPVSKNVKIAAKMSNAALEKREEVLHRDLDGDGEKGESFAHQVKVLGYSKAEQLARGKGKGK